MGNNDVGLFWFCDSNRNWPHSLEGADDAVTFVDKGDTVVLRMRIKSAEEKLVSPWQIRFGIMATPVKPGGSGARERARGWGLTASDEVTIAFTPGWPRAKVVWDLGWPDPVDPEACRKAVRSTWNRGQTPIFYTLFGMSAARPEWSVYGSRWHLDGGQDNFWDNTRFRPETRAPLMATCPGPGMGYAEYFAHYLGEFLKEYNYGGYYRDGMFVAPCANQSHGHGVGGAINYHMESLRRHYRYLYKVVKQQNPEKGWVLGHSSGLLALPIFAYCDSVVLAETLSAVNHHDGDYRKVLSMEELRAEYMGRSKGFKTIFIGQLRGENATPENTRLLMGLLLLHDLVPWETQMHGATARRILTTIDRRFDVGDTHYYPYFKDGTPASIAGEDLHVSLYRRPDGRTLAVVLNMSDTNLRSWLRIAPEALGLDAVSRAYDIENDMDFPREGNAVHVVVRAGDFRLVEIR
jgi:hypothetical protein